MTVHCLENPCAIYVDTPDSGTINGKYEIEKLDLTPGK